MPKMETASITIKISLVQIIDTGNIRQKEKYGPNKKGEWPPEIIDLAMSIKTIGQLQPVNVKIAGEKDGVKQYELIAGFRRRAAHEYLVSIGEDYTQIDAKLTTGNKLTIQLVENIQREDLTAQERETAIYELNKSGMKQKEIAAQLSKTPAFVSVNISAHEMRKQAEAAGVDLTGVETSTLAEFLNVPDGEKVSLLKLLVENGGSRAAANQLAARFKKGKETPTAPEPASIGAPLTSPPPETTPAPGNDNEIDPLIMGGEIPAAEPPKKPQTTKPAGPPPRVDEPIEAEHREIDLNIVLTVIYDYIKELKKLGVDGSDRAARLQTAEMLLALILKKVDDA